MTRASESVETARSSLHYYNAAISALDLLYDSAAAGHTGAAELLAHLSDVLADKADRWRQMQK